MRDKKVPYSFYSLAERISLAQKQQGMAILTKFVRSCKRGFRSDAANILSGTLSLLSMALDRLSSSSRALTQAWSIRPSDMFFITAGEIDTSSTAGPSSFSTTLRFSNLVLRAVERDCRVSISAETAPKSFWKLVRETSTDLRTSSQAFYVLAPVANLWKMITYQDRSMQVLELILFFFICIQSASNII